jgi:hypothetical protein
MDKQKVNKVGIIIFIIFIALFATFSGYVFFNNSSNLEVSIRSNNEQMKRDVAVNEALTKLLVNKNDTISSLGKKIDAIKSIQRKDSVTISKKDKEIKKLSQEKDSLLNVIHNYKWSDIEPITTKPNE